MKKLLLLALMLLLVVLTPKHDSQASSLSAKLKGRILLQVEASGEAWYVNPDNQQRYYLGRPADAFNLMRQLGLGISNKDFDLFNGYASQRLAGKILLKVEDSGKAYYVNPVDLKMHYLGRPADAFQIMRELGLGIKNADLNKVDNATDNAPTPKLWTREFGPFNNNYVVGVKNSGVIFGVQQEVAEENRSESVLNLSGKEYRYKSQLTIKTNGEQTAWWAYDENSNNGSLFLNGQVVAKTQLTLLPHKNDGTINDNMEVNSDLFAINKNGKFAYFDTANNKQGNRTDLKIVYNGKSTVLGEYGFHATLDEYKRSVYLPIKVMLTTDNKLVYAYYDYYKMQVFVVNDGKKYGPYARLNEMTISPNGKNYGWSYVNLENKKNYVMANGKQYGPYDEFSLLGMSDTATAWAVKTGSQAFFMVNNKKYGSITTFENEGVKPTFKASGNNWSIAYTDVNYKTHFIVNGEEVVALDDMCQTELASYFCQEMKVGSNYYAYTKRDSKKIIPEGPGGEIIDSPSSVFVNNKNYGVSADEAMGEQQNQYFGSNGWGFINNKREIIVNGKKVYDLPVVNDLETVTYPQLYVYGNNWIYFEKITTNKWVAQIENSEGCGSGGCLVTDESVPVKNTIYLNSESKQLPSDIHIFMGDIYLSDKYWAYVYFTKLANGMTDFSGGHINYGSIGSLAPLPIYKNSKYNFSFQSLPAWNVSVSNDESDITMNNLTMNSGDNEMIMFIQDNAVFSEVVLEYMNRYSTNYCEIKKSNIVIAGISGVKIERKTKQETCKERGNCQTTCVDYNEDTVVFEKNGRIFILDSFVADEANNLFNKIIETLKFTN